jgi:hypothetical protein
MFSPYRVLFQCYQKPIQNATNFYEPITFQFFDPFVSILYHANEHIGLLMVIKGLFSAKELSACLASTAVVGPQETILLNALQVFWGDRVTHS